MSVSQVREREQDRVYERRLLKERKEEDALFPETEKFVTGAYRQKLSEDAKWEYEDRLAERVEASTDVRGRGMAGFYANLLTKNIAMGGALESAVSAYTAGSERHARLGLDERSEPAESPHSAREPVDETQGEVPLVTKPEAHTQPIERIAEEPSAALVASSAKVLCPSSPLTIITSLCCAQFRTASIRGSWCSRRRRDTKCGRK